MRTAKINLALKAIPPTTREVAAVYDSMADSYDNISSEPFYVNQYRAYENMFRRHLDKNFETALDLGSGTGIFSEKLATRANRVVGIDISKNLLEKAKNKCAHYSNVEFLEASATNIPFAQAEFDVIISFGETISHIQDYLQVFSEVSRVLRPNGLFVFSVLNKWCLRLLYSSSELKSAIRSRAGYWRVWNCEDDSGAATRLPLKTFTHSEIGQLSKKSGLHITDSCGIHITSLIVPLTFQKRPDSACAKLFSLLGSFDEKVAQHEPFFRLGYTCIYAARKE